MGRNLEVITKLYQQASNAEIHAHEFRDVLVQQFSFAVQKFFNGIADTPYATPWMQGLQAIRKYRYTLVFTLLPANDVDIFPSQILEQFQRWRNALQQSYPNMIPTLDAVSEGLQQLQTHTDTPIADIFQTLIGSNESMMLVAADKRQLALHKKALLHSFPNLKIPTCQQSELGGLELFDRLIVIGPAAWFKSHVIAAPRAKRLDVIRPSWIRDVIESNGVFLNNKDVQRIVLVHRSISKSSNLSVMEIESQGVPESQKEPTLNGEDFLDALEVRPLLDVSIIAQRQRNFDGLELGSQELFDARFLVLDGHFGVFLPIDALVYAVDFSKTNDDRVERIKLPAVIENTWIAFRTERSDRELIEQIADRLLGDDRTQFRKLQRDWKQGLENFVQNKGIEKLGERLRFYGAKNASQNNVKRWMSNQSIWMDRLDDFKAVMSVLDLVARENEYIEAMRRIDQAHLMAGQQIRGLLLEKLKTITHIQLPKAHLEISLEGIEGGKFEIFCVIELSSAIEKIPFSRLGKPLPLDD